MVSLNINNDKVNGMENLFSKFPRDYSFEGAYLKGILLHDNGDVQLTYCLETEKTYTFAFVFSECQNDYKMTFSTNRSAIKCIDVSEEKDVIRFFEPTNKIDIKCRQITLSISETLSKEFGEEQANILTQKYSEELQKKFEVLETLTLEDGSPLFRRDDSYNGIVASHHTMYKIDNLSNKDKSLEYEFLIEMDRDDPCLGIYYGCKGLIKKGNNLKQQNVLRDEWETMIKPRVNKRLNELFPDKDFTNRFKPTDNANNNTFWPFWISLYEDENMLEVAVRATIIIRDEYKRYLESNSYQSDETCQYVIKDSSSAPHERHSISRFTEESWLELQNPWIVDSEKQYNGEWAVLLNRFIKGAILHGLLVENIDGYEKAFQVKGTAKHFAIMMQLLVDCIKSDELSVPWEKICRQFLDKGGEPYSEDVLKYSNYRYWKPIKEKFTKKYNKWDFNVKKIFIDDPFPDKHVKEFRKIMQ